jgi:hypothetical protein
LENKVQSIEKDLKNFYLDENNITTDGAIAIAESLKSNEILEALGMSGNWFWQFLMQSRWFWATLINKTGVFYGVLNLALFVQYVGKLSRSLNG